MKIAIYARVSTDEQAQKGFSLPSQIKECKKRAKELGATSITEFVDDGQSGAFLDRPAMNDLRECLRQKMFDVVLCYDPDRLARNLSHQLIITEDIEKAGATLDFINFEWQNTPEGRLFYSIRGAISAYEREKIKERSIRGKKAKAEAGKIVNNVKPYGYDYDKDNSCYIINEAEAEMIREVFKWYTEEKLGMLRIAERLAMRGYKTKTGVNRWGISSVNHILTNEMYIGIAYAFKTHKKKIAPKQYERFTRPEEEWIQIPVPPIIDKETFEKARQQAKINNKLSDRNTKMPYLLRGLVTCAVCGTKMHLHSEKKNGIPYRSFACPTGKRTHYIYIVDEKPDKCPARRVPIHILEKLFWDQMMELAADPDLLLNDLKNAILESQNTGQDISALINDLNEREGKIAKEKEKIIRLLRQDLITEKDAELELRDIKKKLQQLAAERNKLELLQPKEVELDEEQLKEKLKVFSNQFKDVDFETARETVLYLIDEVVVQRMDNFYNTKQREPIIDMKIKLKLNFLF